MKNPSEEVVEIVDRDNRIVGAVQRSRMRREALPHRASYILVFNSRDELFLQKRTAIKDIYPGYWDVAAGGVVLAGESYEDSADRELAEELGVTAPLVHLFDHYYEDQINRVWGRIFRCTHDGPFTLQAEEIAFGRFFTIADALALSRSEPFTPDGVEILRKIQACN
jgi:isopentenyldiphosphate isomerase